MFLVVQTNEGKQFLTVDIHQYADVGASYDIVH